MSHNDLPKFTLLITCDNLAQIFDPKRTINFDRKLIGRRFNFEKMAVCFWSD